MAGQAADRLQKGTRDISYKYDANGLRTYKKVGTEESRYLYLGGKLAYEERGDKKLWFSYDALGTLIGITYKVGDGEYQKYAVYCNSRGDVEGLYGASSGKLYAKYRYDAWGELLSVTDGSGNKITSSTHIGNVNPLRYRSYYYDTETSLYYLQSRYYSPMTKRFLNADGYMQTGQGIESANMYAYCGNNPVSAIDASGRMHILPDMGAPISAAEHAGSGGKIPISSGGGSGDIMGGAMFVGGGLAVADGPLPVGDILGAGIVTGALLYLAARDLASAISGAIADTRKNYDSDTVIYRYGGTNPGNFVPSENDVKSNSGLSFSTVPPLNGQKASVTTIGALNATGVVKAYQDRPRHVRVDPIFATLADWREIGSAHPCTMAIKTVTVKWDGGN